MYRFIPRERMVLLPEDIVWKPIVGGDIFRHFTPLGSHLPSTGSDMYGCEHEGTKKIRRRWMNTNLSSRYSDTTHTAPQMGSKWAHRPTARQFGTVWFSTVLFLYRWLLLVLSYPLVGRTVVQEILSPSMNRAHQDQLLLIGVEDE